MPTALKKYELNTPPLDHSPWLSAHARRVRSASSSS